MYLASNDREKPREANHILPVGLTLVTRRRRPQLRENFTEPNILFRVMHEAVRRLRVRLDVLVECRKPPNHKVMLKVGWIFPDAIGVERDRWPDATGLETRDEAIDVALRNDRCLCYGLFCRFHVRNAGDGIANGLF